MKHPMRRFRYVEPGVIPGSVSAVTITDADAIAYQRQVGLQKAYVYSSDEDALLDFVACHWATEVQESCSERNVGLPAYCSRCGNRVN